VDRQCDLVYVAEGWRLTERLPIVAKVFWYFGILGFYVTFDYFRHWRLLQVEYIVSVSFIRNTFLSYLCETLPHD